MGRICKRIKEFSLRWSLILLYGTLSHWLLQGHMTSYNETVSRQNPWVGNIAKFMMPEGNSALFPVDVDQRPSLQQGLMNFQLQNFQLHTCNKYAYDFLIHINFCFPSSNLNVSPRWETKLILLFPGEPVIKCFLLGANWCFLLGVKNHLNCTPPACTLQPLLHC